MRLYKQWWKRWTGKKKQRGRRSEMEKSVIESATEQLSQLVVRKTELAEEKDNVEEEEEDAINMIPIQPLLSLCNSLIHVLDKIGPTMAVLRQEITQNMQRLEMGEDNLVEIVKKEVREGRARTGSSCSLAFLWLTRSLDFTMTLLEKISNEPGMKMEQAVHESYNLTLKPWHGWISSAAYKIALKLVPDTETFMNIIMENHKNIETTLLEDIRTFVPLLSAFLEQAHSILRLHKLDRIKSK